MLLPVAFNPASMKQYLVQYHDYKYEQSPQYEDYTGYEVIKKVDIREKIVEYLGKVLARCWIEPKLLDQLEDDPHYTLYEMGMILPDDLTIHVIRTKKNRPKLVIYEMINGVFKKICYLQLSMLASKK